MLRQSFAIALGFLVIVGITQLTGSAADDGGKQGKKAVRTESKIPVTIVIVGPDGKRQKIDDVQKWLEDQVNREVKVEKVFKLIIKPTEGKKSDLSKPLREYLETQRKLLTGPPIDRGKAVKKGTTVHKSIRIRVGPDGKVQVEQNDDVKEKLPKGWPDDAQKRIAEILEDVAKRIAEAEAAAEAGDIADHIDSYFTRSAKTEAGAVIVGPDGKVRQFKVKGDKVLSPDGLKKWLLEDVRKQLPAELRKLFESRGGNTKAEGDGKKSARGKKKSRGGRKKRRGELERRVERLEKQLEAVKRQLNERQKAGRK